MKASLELALKKHDLHIEPTKAPLQEETHCYPFGLTKAGISSRAATNAPANKMKYNGKEGQKGEFSASDNPTVLLEQLNGFEITGTILSGL